MKEETNHTEVSFHPSLGNHDERLIDGGRGEEIICVGKEHQQMATFPINGGFSGKITFALEEFPLPCLITGRSLTTGGFVLEKIC